MLRPSGSELNSRTKGVPTNDQRGRGSGPCLLWGGLDMSRHIVPTALLVRVQCFRKDLCKAVEGPSTRPIDLSMITGSYFRRQRRLTILMAVLFERIYPCSLKLTRTVIYKCKRQPYFSIEPLSKTGYWLGVCHGWFHLQGLTGGVKNASWVRISKFKSLAHSGIRTWDLPLTKRAGYHWATKADVNSVDKSSPGF